MNEKFQNNLVNFLKLFKNRPYHLAKYLMDNSALTKDFYNKISKSDKLENNKYFTDITEMNEFYNSILDIKKSKKSIEEITKTANEKMDELIKSENFEQAVRLRDYMTKNKIKRLK
jgi:protein-arginine kinase activator protein McsA